MPLKILAKFEELKSVFGNLKPFSGVVIFF
jgi:hypothetical protein